MVTTSLIASIGPKQIIYGYVHSRKDGDKLIPEYYCSAGPYSSQDGEYRKGVMPVDAMERVFGESSDVLQAVEKSFLDSISNRDIILSQKSYPSNENPDPGQIPLRVLIAAWMNDFHMITNGMTENHLNQQRVDFIKSIPNGNKLYQSVYKYNEYNKTMSSLRLLDVIHTSSCGQKIIPLTELESIRPGDVAYPVWKEIYIGKLASSMIANNVCFNVVALLDWFYIRGVDESIFTNQAMKAKYAQALIGEDIAEDLIETNKKTNLPGSPPTVINNKFAMLSGKILSDVQFIDSAITMSNTAVCVFFEHGGLTAGNIPLIYHAKATQSILNNEMFDRHLFEWCYGLYCLNSKFGVIHGDLHVNNATIYGTVNCPTEVGKTVFVVGDTKYMFPHYGFTATIIDFSRAILGDRERLIDDFGIKYARLLIHQQETALLGYIDRQFPKYVRAHESDIMELITSNYPLAFKIGSLADIYCITQGLGVAFQLSPLIESGVARIGDKVMERIAALSRAAEELFVELMSTAISNLDKNTCADTIDWPNKTLIERMFAANVTPWPAPELDRKLVFEVINSNNPLKYELHDPAKWPPIMDKKFMYEMFKKIDRKPGPLYRLDRIERSKQDNPRQIEAEIADEAKRKYEYEFKPWQFV
jgi:hypothetical protein